MGSHPVVYESKNGWLAALGCCAPRTYNVEEDVAELRGRKSFGEKLVFDEPRPVSIPKLERELSRPVTSYSMGQTLSTWLESGKDIAARASSRASTIRSRTWTGQSGRSRPSIAISAPTDFRRLNEGDALPPVRRRRSFRPLELSIYLPENRLSPLPDFNANDWDHKLADLECPAPALLRSRPPSFATNSSHRIPRKMVRSSVDSSVSSFAGHSRSSSRLSMGTPGIETSRPPSIPWIDPLSSHPPTPPPYQTHYPASTFDRSETRITLPNLPPPPKPISRVSSLSPAPSARSRSMTEPSRGRSTPSPTPPATSQKRGSVRRHNNSCSSNSNPIEDAIRELNTIVEERRAADAYRSSANSLASGGVPPSPSHHIPAIAPTLRMHVRSETLSDIGSAFSVPLASKPLPQTTANTPFTLDETDEAGWLSRPSTSGSMLTFASTKSRISLWLRRQNRSRKDEFPNDFPSSFSSSSPAIAPRPFYQCTAEPQPKSHAQHASISSVSTYASTPSLSGRTDMTALSIVSPVSPESTPSRKARPWRERSASGGMVACGKEEMPRISKLDESHLMSSPLSPSKVGVAF